MSKTYFDCKFNQRELYLNFNSEFYLYDDLNLDFDKYKTVVLIYTFPYVLYIPNFLGKL